MWAVYWEVAEGVLVLGSKEDVRRASVKPSVNSPFFSIFCRERLQEKQKGRDVSDEPEIAKKK